MKWAETCKITATPFQCNKITDNLLNTGGIENLRYGIVWDQSWLGEIRLCKITKKTGMCDLGLLN